jgi:DNA-binding PadR family transcriptional regulator
MQEPTFLILAALATGAQHGYGIMTDVTRISGGRERLRAGTLYAALDRLRTGHLVEVDREEIVEGRLRRYYRLSPEGGRQLAAEARGCSRMRPWRSLGSMLRAGWHERAAGPRAPVPAAAGLVPEGLPA